MTDAKPIEPSTERVANTVAFLLRFSDDYDDLRTKGPETPITEMLGNLTDDRKEKLFLKAHETIAEMDEAMQEPSVMDFFKGINLQEMAEKAKKAAEEAAAKAKETFDTARTVAQGAAEEAAGKLKEMGDKELAEFKKFVGDRYDSLSDEKKAQLLEAYETGNKMYGDTKAAVGDAANKAASTLSSFYNRAKTMASNKPSQGGKRKNKTKKLTKKEKKMKKARK